MPGGPTATALLADLTERRFAVLDCETTGIFPRRYDRILEVAVVVARADGRIEDEFVTLVNPNRDVGPTSIHGIAAADVVNAPPFEAVAGDVLDRLRGAIVVGHNVRFDEGFVRAECDRFGALVPAFPSLCTLEMASALRLGAPSRRLADCCSAAGVRIDHAHSALGDARAASGLLAACLRIAGDQGIASLADLGCDVLPDGLHWPAIPRSGLAFPRSAARRAAAEHVPFLARIVAALPHDSTLSGVATGYLAALDRALADRIVSESEAAELLLLAQSFGLSRGDVEALHRRYVVALRRVALADGQLSDLERNDLDAVARLLGVDACVDEDCATPLSSASGIARPVDDGVVLQQSPDDLAGKSVCFTGELAATIGGIPVSREQAEALAAAAGLVVARGVTKALDLLVLADPQSMSGKAKKARAYGTTLLAEAVFWRAIGVKVD
ncbi:MAG: exonuclease domain-containing protein [Planctomycetota bacterium]